MDLDVDIDIDIDMMMKDMCMENTVFFNTYSYFPTNMDWSYDKKLANCIPPLNTMESTMLIEFYIENPNRGYWTILMDVSMFSDIKLVTMVNRTFLFLLCLSLVVCKYSYSDKCYRYDQEEVDKCPFSFHSILYF